MSTVGVRVGRSEDGREAGGAGVPGEGLTLIPKASEVCSLMTTWNWSDPQSEAGNRWILRAILSGQNMRATLDQRAWYERAWPTTSGLEYERACRSTSRGGLLATGHAPGGPRDRSRVEESWPHRPHQQWRCPRHGSLNRCRPKSG